MSVLTDIRPVGRNIPRILTWSKCKAHSLRFGACSGDVDCKTTKTPDIQVILTKKYWEIKNIKGNGKLTIEDNLRKAAKQSNYIVISLLRSTMTPEKAISHIQWYLKHARANIKQVILVTKRGKTIDF